MKQIIILATRNKGKLRELRALLKDLPIEVKGLDGFDVPSVVEDGRTFLENALKKAKAVALATGLPALADDSGLEVEALGWAPGVYSARYAGPEATDEDRNAKLLEALASVPPERRRARFRCVAVVYHPSYRWFAVEGICEGYIAEAPKGEHGFGYDPVFFVPEFGKTMAELSPEIKNKISHRARAMNRVKEILPGFLGLKAE
ncbi:XTP/dITP diphosphatase [Thermosulfuriphilus sp.]